MDSDLSFDFNVQNVTLLEPQDCCEVLVAVTVLLNYLWEAETCEIVSVFAWGSWGQGVKSKHIVS